jgi:hypothetical protein
VEQFVAIMGSITALIGAVTVAIVQLRQTHSLVNSRMSELLDVTKRASLAEGRLEGPGPPGGSEISRGERGTPPTGTPSKN